MSALIEDLRKEHEAILVEMRSVRQGQGIAGRETRERLLLAKRLFLSHLEKEDQEFYPVLRKAAEKDLKLHQKLEELKTEMREVTVLAVAFFDKYPDGSMGDNFIADCAALLYRLEARLIKEENLYSEAEKYFAAQ